MRAGGELRLVNYDTPSTITALTGDIVIDVGRFTNLAGPSALITPSGRFLVYSTNWANDIRGGLTGANLYGRSYAANPPMDGGEIVLWSDGHTAFDGSISARGQRRWGRRRRRSFRASRPSR